MPGSSWSWKERARWGCFPHVLTVPCGSGPGPSPARKQSVRLVTFCCKPRRRWGQPVAPASSLRKKQHLPPPNYLHSSKYSFCGTQEVRAAGRQSSTHLLWTSLPTWETHTPSQAVPHGWTLPAILPCFFPPCMPCCPKVVDCLVHLPRSGLSELPQSLLTTSFSAESQLYRVY